MCDNYDLICVLDTDTIFVDKCDYMWKEAEDALLVFDVDYSLESPKRLLTNKIAKQYFNIKTNINHWGGEILVGTSKRISNIINECTKVYEKIIPYINDIDESFGQEALLSIAIENSNIKVERANKYCMRYWTRRYYLVDTNFNNIPVWHLPAEKDCGLLDIYTKIIKDNKLPNKSYLGRKLFLRKKMGYYSKFRYYSKLLFLKIRNRKSINFSKKTGWIDK